MKGPLTKAFLEWGRFMLIAFGVLAIFDWYVIPLAMGLPPMSDWFLLLFDTGAQL